MSLSFNYELGGKAKITKVNLVDKFLFHVFSLQAELIVGDQSGVIHIWDLKTDHNEQLIPEPEVSVNAVHIDPDASYMAAVNSSVSASSV